MAPAKLAAVGLLLSTLICHHAQGVFVASIEGGGSRGRLNAIVNGQRGTVCDYSPSNALAAVVCRQLGFNTSNAIITKVPPSASGTSLPIVLANVVCAGNETSLDECQYKTQLYYCGHYWDLGVDCQIADAAVICEQLGFNGSLALIASTAVIDRGTGPIWLSNLQCTGSEANIASCRHDGYGIHSCSHGRDASLFCPAGAEVQVRLVGPLPDRGRLEVNIFNESWGTVCDYHFDAQDAAVVCRMLGLSTKLSSGTYPSLATFVKFLDSKCEALHEADLHNKGRKRGVDHSHPIKGKSKQTYTTISEVDKPEQENRPG
ncbi:hypothetical protein ACOMHN_023661 [Nucella lapillus]